MKAKQFLNQVGLKVEEVLGEEVSFCKVTKGEKEVKTALDNGSTLVVIVRD